MFISKISDEQIKEYCGINDDDSNIDLYKAAAKSFIMGYTNMTDEEIETHEDITLAYMVLINDMSFNRDYTVSKDTLNPCVNTILSMYSKNQIG